jgi:glycosyltransferase involved in cell wall biosynthesis
VRILQITAGAGGMYCGSCVRDNALAAATMAAGHDVTLLPLYTPTLTDEKNVSDERVFFGGVSVYLQQHVPLFRHTPAIVDRLLDAPPLLRAVSSRAVSTDPRKLGGLTTSMLRGEVGHQKKEIAKLVAWLQAQPKFDLVVLPNTMLIGLARPLRRLGLPVACTMQGEDLVLQGLPDADRARSKSLITAQADDVDLFLSVSDYYSGFMADYLGLPRERMRTVPIGIALDDYVPREPTRTPPFKVGYFARLCPEKGFSMLVEAFHHFRHLDDRPEATIEAAGFLPPNEASFLAEQKRILRRRGHKMHWHGTLDRAGKLAFLRSIDVLCVPSLYAEPKGLYVLEAMASGVPVVQPRVGAFTELVDRTGGGLLVDADGPASIARGLSALYRDPERTAELGRAAAAGVRREYSAARMAARALDAYQETIEVYADRTARAAAAPPAPPATEAPPA